jgi:hypothetical protein
MGATHRWTRFPLSSWFSFVPVFILLAGPTLAGCGVGGSAGNPETVPGENQAGLPPTAAQTELTEVAHTFMAALSDRDVARLDGMLAPGATLYSVREGEGGTVYGVRTREEFLEGLSAGGDRFLERIWDPVVEVRGRTGMVWAPYDFHLNGAFSHCGIDVLTLLRLEEGWKVTSITYDVVRENCEASPLGAPEG